MKKTIIMVVLFLLLSSFLFSQETVGVLDISPRQGVSAVEAQIVTDFVYDALYRFGGGKYMIISRQNREAILAEHEFSMSGFCDDASCALEVGKYLSADLVVIGSFTKFGSKYYLSLQLVDVNTTTVAGSAREGADDLDAVASTAVDACVAGIFGSTRPAAAQAAVTPALAPPQNLKIGDRHAGGIVFYLDGKGGGLVCAEDDQSKDIQWGGRGTTISGTSTAVGTGAANTAAIVSKLGNGIYAAKLCVDLQLNGHDDWFLPSRNELNLMYQNLHKKGLGGFGSGYYWSSSELDSGLAWAQYFLNGYQYYSYKSHASRVLAVRAF